MIKRIDLLSFSSKLLVNLIRRPRGPDILGFVERIRSDCIQGWAISRAGEELHLALRIDGRSVALRPTWHQRADVSTVHGSRFTAPGFICNLEDIFTIALREAAEFGRRVSVTANGVSLQIGGMQPIESLSGLQEPLNIPIREGSVEAAIESWGGFTIRGWVACDGLPAQRISIRCNGVAVECPVIRRPRAQVPRESNAGAVRTGFELELPASIWATAEGSAVVQVEVVADATLLTPTPLRLDRDLAARWIAALARLEECEELAYLSLLAFEHVRAGALYPHLDPAGRKFVGSGARAMDLTEFVFPEGHPDELSEPPTLESASTLQLWSAMRELNARLVGIVAGTPVFEHVMLVLNKHQLAGDARDWYMFLATQLTCETGEFHRLAMEFDAGKLREFASSHFADQLSLSLPGLVAASRLIEAADVLKRLAKVQRHGWVHTYCIRFAVNEVQRLSFTGVVDVAAARAFRLSLIGLLDDLNGDWFSRHQDIQLVHAMVSLVLNLDMLADSERVDTVAAAIRNYGLCPAFWEQIQACGGIQADADIAKAHQMWQHLRATLEVQWTESREAAGGMDLINARLANLLEAVTWFYRWGNRDALVVARDALANSVSSATQGETSSLVRLSDFLFSSSPVEVIRLAAMPHDDGNFLEENDLDSRGKLLETLRTNSGADRSDTFKIQCAAGASLRAARDERDPGSAATLLAQLNAFSNHLGASAGYVGVDLLVYSYAIALERGFAAEPTLMLLREKACKAIAASDVQRHLPPPLLCAANRLEACASGELAFAVLREIRSAIKERFGDSHDYGLALPSAPAIALRGGSSYFGDTLVVILVAKRNSASMELIRRTWLSDLTAYEIPHLFVIESGATRLCDDVLELQVSPGQSGAETILNLFSWIMQNSEAQYVVRIEDDCYLDVERYFGSLCYRRHHYYGRRTAIKADAPRTFSKRDSESALQIKGLDKSPSPSVWADGNGAYMLSRLAIVKLLEGHRVPSGARLLACSRLADKFVGDMLASQGIFLADDDYETCLRQRDDAASIAVSWGANTFYPAPCTPTMVLKLGTPEELPEARERSRVNSLWPRKIWPTCYLPSVRANSSQLELLSDKLKTEVLLRSQLFVVSVVRNECTILKHFLAHYRELGVSSFIFCDNGSDDGTREFLHAQPDIILFSTDTDYRESHYGVTWQQAIVGNFCLGKWVVVADADEFLVYRDSETRPLAQYVAELESDGSDAALLYMIDMYPYGDLADACFESGVPFDVAPYFDREPLVELKFGGGQFSNSRNFVNGLRHRIAPSRINAYVSQKYALFKYRPWIRLSEGLHYAANMKVSPVPGFFAHFKYHAGFKQKVLTEVRRKQHFNGAEEYRRYGSMLTEGNGGFGTSDKSVRYRDSGSFLELLGKVR